MSLRKEKRIVQIVAVRVAGSRILAMAELAFTENVSSHGARIVTHKVLPVNQELEISSIAGNLKGHARVIYCQPLPNKSYAIGLELYNPSGKWLIHSLRELDGYSAQP